MVFRELKLCITRVITRITIEKNLLKWTSNNIIERNEGKRR
jgi:hypothetical protein